MIEAANSIVELTALMRLTPAQRSSYKNQQPAKAKKGRERLIRHLLLNSVIILDPNVPVFAEVT